MQTFFILFLLFFNFLLFSQGEIKRDPDSRKDWANVFYKSQYTLFDLWSDEPIFVSSDGKFHIYYATNENKTPQELVATPQQVSTYSVYKFKNYENCKNWCDGKIYTNENLTPDFQQVDVRASDIQWDDNNNSSSNNNVRYDDPLNIQWDDNQASSSNNNVDFELSDYQKQLLKSGISKSTNKDFQGAIVDLTSLINQEPRCLIAYFFRGASYGVLNDYKNSINDETYFINNITPKYSELLPQAYLVRGGSYIQIQNKTEGCSDLKKTINNPDIDQSYYEKNCLDQNNTNNQRQHSSSNHTNQQQAKASSFQFVRPALNITWIDNRKSCCCCNTNMGKYEESKAENKETAEINYLMESLYVYHKKNNASESVINSDLQRLQVFVANNYNSIVALGVPINYPMLKLFEIDPSYKFASKNVKVNIYRVVNKKCGRCKGYCMDDRDCRD